MALLEYRFYSQILEQNTMANVILPDGEPPVEGFPTLWLLHGLSDNHTAWSRNSNIEKYVEGKGLAVVMPDAYRSYYTNMQTGLRYWDFISEEIQQIMRRTFRLSQRREDNFAAGLSMGGYGAFKLGLRNPERYAAVCSLSGALDIRTRLQMATPEQLVELKSIFGDVQTLKSEGNDLIALAEQITEPDQYPRFYQACGTEDFLYQYNQNFLCAVKVAGLDISYTEAPGSHTWDFWDTYIQEFLKFISIES